MGPIECQEWHHIVIVGLWKLGLEEKYPSPQAGDTAIGVGATGVTELHIPSLCGKLLAYSCHAHLNGSRVLKVISLLG